MASTVWVCCLLSEAWLALAYRWVWCLRPSNLNFMTSLHRALGSMLLPLASSTVSEALSLLSRIREFEPPAGNCAVHGLEACIKQLPLCVKSAEEILPALQASCSAMCKAPGRASDATMPSYAYMLGSAVASLHRCNPCQVLQLLRCHVHTIVSDCNRMHMQAWTHKPFAGCCPIWH